LSSSDSDGTITQYGWQFGDGALGSGATVSHTFAVGRAYRVQLVVTDDRGGLGASIQTIDLNQRPVVSLSATCSGLTCTFDGSASFDPDGTIAFFIWRFGDGRDGTGPATMTHTYPAAGTYIVTLTATDNSYGTGARSQTVTVINVNAPPIASFTSSCSVLTCSFNASGVVGS
jgi:PKD repeat protein